MDESTDEPKILANKIIKQMVEHMLADAPVLKGADFMVIRTVFRSMEGEWQALTNGDTEMLALLKSIITTWGAQQKPPTQSDFI